MMQQVTTTELANNGAMNIDALLTSAEAAPQISAEEYALLLEAEECLFAIRNRMATAEKRVA